MVLPGVDADREIRLVVDRWGGKVPSQSVELEDRGRRFEVGKSETIIVTSPLDRGFRLELPLTLDPDDDWYLTAHAGQSWIDG